MRTKHYILLVIAGLCIAGAGAWALWARVRPSVSTDWQAAGSQPSAPVHQDKALVHLYFADPDNAFLIAEERVLPGAADPATLGRAIVNALIQGPETQLLRTIPEQTELRALYVTSEGIAYVDLSRALQQDHPGGAQTELLTVYAIVNTLVLNATQIASVKVLIEGQESDTLAGHVSLREPLKANMLLIR
jgi:spore germination protein GerM